MRFERWEKIWFCLLLTAIPLSISASYVLLIPALGMWLVSTRKRLFIELRNAAPVIDPLLAFAVCGLAAAPLGIDPLSSIQALLSLFFISFTILFTFNFVERTNLRQSTICFLLAAQSFAALHSLAAAALPGVPDLSLVGEMTESGQLLLCLFLALSIVVDRPDEASAFSKSGFAIPWILPLAVFTVLLSGAFIKLVCANQLLCRLVPILTTASAGIGLVFFVRALTCDSRPRVHVLLTNLIIPLLVTALVVNLKRGAWIGVAAGAFVFLLLHRRALLPPLLAVIALVIMYVEPVRQRLELSYDHFRIAGGRSVIWQIGTEFSAKYPTGIGFENSSILTQFDPDIPSNLTHFHNNFLNILVECGWLGLGIFLWWLISILSACFARQPAGRSAALSALGCGVLAWGVAGIFEYSFGDTEVMLVLFVYLGWLLALKKQNAEDECRPGEGPVTASL